MKVVRRILLNVFMYASWGLALYLFYTGNILGGLGALTSTLFVVVGLGFGEVFAERFGPDAINKAREEGRVEGRKESA